jgi:tetratricopeptide (TPR) repeat protein
MKSSSTPQNHIENLFESYRKAWARFQLALNSLRWGIFLIASFFVLIISEAIWYWPSETRKILDSIYLVILFSGVMLTYYRYKRIRQGSHSDFTPEAIAIKIGERYTQIHDRLLNVYQLFTLKEPKKGYSPELVKWLYNTLKPYLNKVEVSSDIPRNRLRNWIYACTGTIVIITIITIIWFSPLWNSFARISHPDTQYPVPLPFAMIVQPGNMEILGGDTLSITVLTIGDVPDQLFLEKIFKDKIETSPVLADTNAQSFVATTPVFNDFRYRVFYPRPHFWTPWNEISSPYYTIKVINRPSIHRLDVKLSYPGYSKLGVRYQEGNINEISALKGTYADLKISADKPLTRAVLNFDDGKQIYLKSSGSLARGRFRIMKDASFTIHLKDINSVENINPIEYTVTSYPDQFPAVKLLSPDSDVNLGEDFLLPLTLELTDDFGFSALELVYTIKHPDYLEPDSTIYHKIVPIEADKPSPYILSYSWNLSGLNLAPDDMVEYFFQVLDNDSVSGPKIGKSSTYTARFPSIAEMFAGLDEQRQETMISADETLEIAGEVRNLLEEVQLEMKKNPEMTWDKQAKIESAMEKQKEAQEKLEQTIQKLEEMVEKAGEEKLFSPEILKKYVELQTLFQNVLTDELKEAMKRLQEALEKMDNKEIRDALKQFQITQEAFEKELDRALEIFKRVEIEQNLEQAVKRMEELLKRQQSLLKDAEKTSQDDLSSMNRLSKREADIQQEMDQIRSQLALTRDLMEDFPLMPSGKLDSLLNSETMNSLLENLKATSRSFQKGKFQEGIQSGEIAKMSLEEMTEMLKSFQSGFMQQSMEEVVSQFQEIIQLFV